MFKDRFTMIGMSMLLTSAVLASLLKALGILLLGWWVIAILIIAAIIFLILGTFRIG